MWTTENTTASARWRWRIEITRPTRACLTLLADWERADNRLLPNRADAAIDVPTTTRAEAEAVQVWLQRHAILKHCREAKVRWDRDTRYNNRRTQDGCTVLAGYVCEDRRAAHIEVRLMHDAERVRRVGIRRAADFLNVDPARVFLQKVDFAAINYGQLGRQLLGRARAKVAHPADRIRGVRDAAFASRGAGERYITATGVVRLSRLNPRVRTESALTPLMKGDVFLFSSD